jgi:hypothetical protein
MERSDEKTVTDEMTSTASEELTVDETIDEVAGNRTVDGRTTETASADGSLTSRLGDLFSLKAFLLSVAVLGIGVVGGGAVPLVGTVGSLGGLFLAAFGIGLVTSKRRYLEIAVAGGGIVGLNFGLSLLSTGVLPVGFRYVQEYGLAFAGIGVGIGALLGLVGHYFGRDLRDGVTQEI